MNSWRAFWRFRTDLRGLALESAGVLTLTWLGLRSFGFRRWQKLLTRMMPAAPAAGQISESELDRCRAIARIERSVARRLPFQSNCLDQSVALWWMLRRRGVAAQIQIGGRREAASFEAHAWVEAGGNALPDGGEVHPHFAPFDGPIKSVGAQTH